MLHKLSIVVPVFQNSQNLRESIPHYIEYLRTISPDVELICVDDGSTDGSFSILKELQSNYPQDLKVLKLVRNFGQASAIYAGLSVATGNVHGVISADKQDPIELFSEMIVSWQHGFKLVIAARKDRLDRGISVQFSRLFNWLLGRLINPKYPKGGFDFFLMDKEVSQHLLEISERDSMIQVLLLWMGYDFATHEYVRQERTAGKSQWSFKKRFRLVIDTITTNSHLPLRIISVSGLFFSALAFMYATYTTFQALYSIITGQDFQVRGWASTVTLIAFFSGLILFSLGVIGEYVWRIFNHIKRRPMYIIERK